MPSDTSIETATAFPGPPSIGRRLWLIVPLVLMAAFETWDGWTSFAIPASIAQRSATGQIFLVVHIVTQPLLGAAALVLALTGRVRAAIMLLAANIVLRWLTADLYDPVNWRFSSFFSIQETAMNLIIMPVAGFLAAGFAARNTRLGLATLLVCVPTLYLIVMVAGFFIGVMLYGF